MSVEAAPGENHFKVLDVEGWIERWNKRDIGFHEEEVNIMLAKHAEKMLNGRENIDIFVPLCGKSVDMKWLAERGHSVVGVECCDRAIQEFFEEQKLSFTTEAVDEIKGVVYKCEEKKIKIYCCDVYLFSKDVAGQFDAIWDRGSMVSINREDRKKYSEVLMNLMRSGCRTFIDSYNYDENLHPGPPHYVSGDQIHSLFGESCSVEQIDCFDVFAEKYAKWGLNYLDEKLHLIIKN